MEVHQHSHKPNKKWSHYFWDFMMLFLAVTLGFLVENQREHYIEHKREKQFARHLLADLEEDSVFFKKRIGQIKSYFADNDKFLNVMMSTPTPDLKEMLAAGLPLLYEFDVQATTTTFNQMKATGSLRYIKDYELTASLEKYYDIMIPRAVSNAADAHQFYHDYITSFVLKHFRVQDVDLVNDKVINENPIMYGRSPETDQELLNIMENYVFINKTQLERVLLPSLQKVNELIAMIKKEYHLK